LLYLEILLLPKSYCGNDASLSGGQNGTTSNQIDYSSRLSFIVFIFMPRFFDGGWLGTFIMKDLTTPTSKVQIPLAPSLVDNLQLFAAAIKLELTCRGHLSGIQLTVLIF
jgi:hypothetical protein